MTMKGKNLVKNYINKIKREKFWNQLFKNVGLVFFGTAGASVFNFITTFLIIHATSNTLYGYFLLAQQYMLLIDKLVNFQSWQGVIKYGAEYKVKNDEERLKAVFKAGFLIDLITAVLGCVVSFSFLGTAQHLMHWDPEVVILGYLFCSEIIFHLEGTCTGIIRLYDKFKYSSSLTVGVAIAQFIAIGIMYLFHCHSIFYYTLVFVLFDIISKIGVVVIACNILHHSIGIKAVLQSKPTKVLDSKFFKYTMWSNVSSTCDIPIQYFDLFIIGQISVEMVTVYKIYKQIIQMMSKLTVPISTAILPQFSELVAEGREKEGYDKVLKIRKTVLYVMAPFIILGLIFGKPLFNIFFGKIYGDHIVIFEILLIIYSISFAYVAIHPYFAAIGKVKEDFGICLSTNIVYCLVLFVLVKPLGIYAILIGTAIQFELTFFIKKRIIKNYLASI